MNSAKVALSLVALLVLAGCSSSYGPAPAAGGTACAPPPCDPCAPVVAPCDPCAPIAQAPLDPAGARPPSANPGEVWCYIRIPAVTRTVSEQVCVQPASCRQEWVPPVTKEVCEQVCVQPESCRQIPIPAQYETVCEQVMTCPGKTEWRKVACEPHSLSEGEQLGECWTLAEIPPVYDTRSKQVCTQPESCRQEIIPAKYESQSRTITVQEGFYKSIEVPAVYETRCREEMVCPSRWEWRRTTECEVPGADIPAAVPGMAPMIPADVGMPLGADGAMPLPPDDMMPPAGELPPADPFAR